MTCPTLGCRAARAKQLPPAGALLVRPHRPWWAPLFSCPGIAIGLIGALCGLVSLKSYLGAPAIEIRNDTGVTLGDVRVEAYQYEGGTRVVSAATLAPGESIAAHGFNDGYEMSLRNLQLTGVTLARFPDDPFDFPGGGSYRHRCVPGQRSVYAIDAAGRMRTIQHGDWGGTRRCTCPDGNANRTGSPGCPINIHSHDVERATAPVSARGTR